MAAAQKYKDKDLFSDSQLREKYAKKGEFENITWTSSDRKTNNLQTELDKRKLGEWAEANKGKIAQIIKQAVYTEHLGAGQVGFTKIIDEISKAAPKEAVKGPVRIIPSIQKTVQEGERKVAEKSGEPAVNPDAKLRPFVVPKKAGEDISLGKTHLDLAEEAKKNGETQRAIFEYALASDYYLQAKASLGKQEGVPQTLLKEVSSKQGMCAGELGVLRKNSMAALEQERSKFMEAAGQFRLGLENKANSDASLIALRPFSLLSPSTWLPDFIRRPFGIGVDQEKTKQAREAYVATAMNGYLSASKDFEFAGGAISPRQALTPEQEKLGNEIQEARRAGANANNAFSTLSYLTEGPKIMACLNDAIGKYDNAISALPESPESKFVARRLAEERSKLQEKRSELERNQAISSIQIATQKEMPQDSALGEGASDAGQVERIVGLKPAPGLNRIVRKSELKASSQVNESVMKSISGYFAALNLGDKSSRMTIKIGGGEQQPIQDYALKNGSAKMEDGKYSVDNAGLREALKGDSQAGKITIEYKLTALKGDRLSKVSKESGTYEII